MVAQGDGKIGPVSSGPEQTKYHEVFVSYSAWELSMSWAVSVDSLFEAPCVPQITHWQSR